MAGLSFTADPIPPPPAGLKMGGATHNSGCAISIALDPKLIGHSTIYANFRCEEESLALSILGGLWGHFFSNLDWDRSAKCDERCTVIRPRVSIRHCLYYRFLRGGLV